MSRVWLWEKEKHEGQRAEEEKQKMQRERAEGSNTGRQRVEGRGSSGEAERRAREIFLKEVFQD